MLLMRFEGEEIFGVQSPGQLRHKDLARYMAKHLTDINRIFGGQGISTLDHGDGESLI